MARCPGSGGCLMADKSKIEWTDATWNPVTGCTKVSPGCANCYAERLFPRVYGREEVFVLARPPEERPRQFTDVGLHHDRLDHPINRRKPIKIFVCSMGDLFHEAVPDEFIAKVWTTMYMASKQTFQVLTKRPERMRDWLLRCSDDKEKMGWITHDGTSPKSYGGTGIIVGADGRWLVPIQ